MQPLNEYVKEAYSQVYSPGMTPGELALRAVELCQVDAAKESERVTQQHQEAVARAEQAEAERDAAQKSTLFQTDKRVEAEEKASRYYTDLALARAELSDQEVQQFGLLQDIGTARTALACAADALAGSYDVTEYPATPDCEAWKAWQVVLDALDKLRPGAPATLPLVEVAASFGISTPDCGDKDFGIDIPDCGDAGFLVPTPPPLAAEAITPRMPPPDSYAAYCAAAVASGSSRLSEKAWRKQLKQSFAHPKPLPPVTKARLIAQMVDAAGQAAAQKGGQNELVPRKGQWWRAKKDSNQRAFIVNVRPGLVSLVDFKTTGLPYAIEKDMSHKCINTKHLRTFLRDYKLENKLGSAPLEERKEGRQNG